MRLMFSSKTVEFTDQLKLFFQTKLLRLKKFSSLGIQNVQVVIDRVKRKGSTTSDASVEVIAEVKGRKFAFKEVGGNVYQAFYRVYAKIESMFGREVGKRKR